MVNGTETWLNKLIAPSLMANPLRGGSPPRDKSNINKIKEDGLIDQKKIAFFCFKRDIMEIVIIVYIIK